MYLLKELLRQAWNCKRTRKECQKSNYEKCPKWPKISWHRNYTQICGGYEKRKFFSRWKKSVLKKIFLNMFLKQILMYKNFPYEGTWSLESTRRFVLFSSSKKTFVFKVRKFIYCILGNNWVIIIFLLFHHHFISKTNTVLETGSSKSTIIKIPCVYILDVILVIFHIVLIYFHGY